jgi:hypothetical protein
MNSGRRSSKNHHTSHEKLFIQTYLGSPGKTLMLLKKASKPSRKGFKRKKVNVLGSFKEIMEGTKKI